MNHYTLARSMKEPTGPVIKRILVRCPSTGRLAATGKTVEEALWADTKLNRPRLTCPHCGEVHAWTKQDGVLARARARGRRASTAAGRQRKHPLHFDHDP